MGISERFENLKTKVNEYQTLYNALCEDIENLEGEVETIRQSLTELRENKKQVGKANEVIKQLIEEVFNKKIKEYTSLVNRGLQSIFEDRMYEFDVEVDDYGSSKKAKLLYRESKEGGWTNWRNVDEGSGAVRTTIDLISRLYLIKVLGKRRLLVFDESLNAIAGRYRSNVIQFLKELASGMDFDIILVSHNQDIVENVDTVYEVDDGEVSKVQ